MRCLHCDYLLFNLSRPVCPECGRDFDVAAYRFEPGDVSFHCPHCDQAYYGNDAQGLPSPRVFDCVKCYAAVRLQALRVVPCTPTAMGEVAGVIPWEGRRPGQGQAAWWTTVKMLLFEPTKLFRTTMSRSTRDAWVFALIATYLGTLMSAVYSLIAMWALDTGWPGVSPGGGLPVGTADILFMVAAVAIGPLIATTAGAYIGAALIHVALLLIAPQRRDFDCTVRLSMYAMAGNVILVVPFLGDYVGAVWGVVISIIGIREWHRTTGWRAALAQLWPLVALAGLAVVVAMFMFAV